MAEPAGHAFLGEHALHLPGARPIALGRGLLPRGALAVVVGGDRERFQRLEVDLLGPVGVEQLGGRVSEAEPLLNQTLGDAEARGDGGDGDAGLGELRERDHLVGRVHRDADDVLGERELACIAVCRDLAGHRMVGVERAVVCERLQRREAASAGDDGEAFDAVRVRAVGAGDEVLQQPVGLDGRLELDLGEAVGRGSCARSRAQARAGQSGISRMSGSGGEAMWFMEVSVDEGTGAARGLCGPPAPARPGLVSASTGCPPGARAAIAGGWKRSPGTSSGEGWRAGAGSAVPGGGSARSAASSRRRAALRSAVAASRMHRALTGISG